MGKGLVPRIHKQHKLSHHRGWYWIQCALRRAEEHAQLGRWKGHSKKPEWSGSEHNGIHL
jgi:hypothetical protein